jgi:hypothetical protein
MLAFLEPVSALVFIAILVFLVSLCADSDQPEPPAKPTPTPTPAPMRQPSFDGKQPIFERDLDEMSENAAFHNITGDTRQICFAMDDYNEPGLADTVRRPAGGRGAPLPDDPSDGSDDGYNTDSDPEGSD